MPASVNKVILLGRLSSDPKVKTFDNGGKIVNFQIATSDVWFDDNGQKQERSQFTSVQFSNRGKRKPADAIAKHFKKGDGIYVEGKMRTRTYEKDGAKHWHDYVDGFIWEFPPGKKQGNDDSDEGTSY